MKQFKLEDVKKMGEPHETYGQAYWCAVMGELDPVKFNSQNTNIVSGTTVEAEEWVNKQSAKGIDYIQLRKVKVSAPQPSPNHTSEQPAQTNEHKLDQILELVKEIHSATTKNPTEEQSHNRPEMDFDESGAPTDY